MDFKESAFMYIIGGAVVVFVLAQSLFFLISLPPGQENRHFHRHYEKHNGIKLTFFNCAFHFYTCNCAYPVRSAGNCAAVDKTYSYRSHLL